MYDIFGVVGLGGPARTRSNLEALDQIASKFPGRSSQFERIIRDDLILTGENIRSCTMGSTEMFFTGVIYNLDEVLVQQSSSPKDELGLLAFLLEHGESGASRLNGRFAIVLLDKQEKSCRIFNDPMGTSQIFYHMGRDFLVFSSELKYMFCHPRCPREIDWVNALKRPIPFIVVNPELNYNAWFKQIELLKEGSVLEASQSTGVNVRTYWNPWAGASGPGAKSDRSLEQYCDEYLALLDDAVRLRCATPDSAFAMFSGGLDSSIIAALAQKHTEVQTYSFATQATVQDGSTSMCQLLSSDMHLPNTQVVIPYDTMMRDGLLWQQRIWSSESPLAHKDAISKTILHAAISEVNPDARHIMTGTGSDQLNGGLVRWMSMDEDDLEPGERWENIVQNISTEYQRRFISHAYDPFWNSRDVLDVQFIGSLRPDGYHEYPWPQFVHGCIHANQFVLLWDENRAASWYDRGIRYPFLDHRFAEFMLGIPRDLHAELFYDKQILRHASRKVLPGYLADRPKMPGFRGQHDQRIETYRQILFGKDRHVLNQLLAAIDTKGHPVNKARFMNRLDQLCQDPDQLGWEYLMHIAGLITLGELPYQTEQSCDFYDRVSSNIDVVRVTSPNDVDRIGKMLGIGSPEDVYLTPVDFMPGCSLMRDVFSDAVYVTKDDELLYELDDDYPDWCTFLFAVGSGKSVREICDEKNLDRDTFDEFFKTCLREGILQTTQTVAHETA